MNRFREILVGVDLSTDDRLVCPEPYGPSAEAVQSGFWLAQQSGAALRFLYSLDASAATERLIAEHRGNQANVFDEASAALRKLVERAEAVGVAATAKVAMGNSWLHLIREVITGHHDLLIVGTRKTSRLQNVLIGSTAMKLLRKCPCPVWVTHPPRPEPSNAVLVAHGLTDVGDQALELGASMAELTGGQLHILHVLQMIDFGERFAAEHAVMERRRADALKQLRDRVDALNWTGPLEVSVAVGLPAEAILEAIGRYQIELLVMGTVARTGIRGLLMGNTAERLLPQLPCSVLAVKPEGFECPLDVFQLD